LAPAKLFLTLASSAAPKFQRQQMSRQQKVGGLIITGRTKVLALADEVIE